MKYSSNRMTISLSKTQSVLLMRLPTAVIVAIIVGVAVVTAPTFNITFAFWRECNHIQRERKRGNTKSYDNFKWNVNTNMTIWYVHNRLDQPNATIANQKRNKSVSAPIIAIESVTRHVKTATQAQATSLSSSSSSSSSHSLNVKWLPRMHVIALKLSHCWRLILYAIIISVISRAPPPVNGNNNNNAAGMIAGMQAAKMLPTPAASTWSSNFFDADRIQCPSFVDNSACPCYKFEDGK